MRGNRAPRRKVAARRRDVRRPDARQQRSEQQHRPAQPADQRAIRHMAAQPSARGRAASCCRCRRTSAPRSRSSRAITSTSPIRGTLVSTHSSSVSRHAASSGSAAFLLPSTATRPWSRWPPSISSVDIQLRSLLEKRHVRIIAEPDEHRLRPKPDAEAIGDPPLDPHRQRQHVACRRAAPVHDRQRMLGRDAGAARVVNPARNPTARSATPPESSRCPPGNS